MIAMRLMAVPGQVCRGHSRATVRYLLVIVLIFTGALREALATQVTIPAIYTTVEVRRELHTSGQATYHYRIVNRRTTPIAMIFIGLWLETAKEPDLLEEPIGWVPDENDCPASIVSPRDWTACVGRQEDSRYIFLMFEAENESAYLQPNRELTFAVTLNGGDPSYETARFEAFSTDFPHERGRVVRVASGR